MVYWASPFIPPDASDPKKSSHLPILSPSVRPQDPRTCPPGSPGRSSGSPGLGRAPLTLDIGVGRRFRITHVGQKAEIGIGRTRLYPLPGPPLDFILCSFPKHHSLTKGQPVLSWSWKMHEQLTRVGMSDGRKVDVAKRRWKCECQTTPRNKNGSERAGGRAC